MSSIAQGGCVYPGCPRGVFCRGWCKPHYEQQRRGYPLRPLLEVEPLVCRMDNCGKLVHVRRRQLCMLHYEYWRRGILDGIPPRACENCGKVFTPRRAITTKCCSDRCHQQSARLFKAYGLRGADLRRLLDEQDHRCAICRDPIRREQRGLDIDHDHVTGQVRGLLCGACNRGLGHFKDRPDVLVAAAEYLRKSLAT